MQELEILALTNLYILRVCSEIHPFIHQTAQKNRPEHNHDYIWTTQIHDYPTRHSLQQHHYVTNPYTTKPTHTIEHYTRQYTKIWNTLPTALRTNRSLPDFKIKLKKYLLEVQNETEH